MAFGSHKTGATVVPPDVQNIGHGNSDQHLMTAEERRLLWKLDLGILVAASFGWFMGYVDQANLTSAYVSGMKEDLNITGNQYTYMNTSYLVAFSIMQLPSSIIGLKIRPSIWLFSCEIGWTIFTFAQAGARTSTHMYFFRFMVGLFESAFSPVIIFLLGSWYTKPELAKRSSTWLLTGFLGEACSGFMQATIYDTLDGRNGLAGWRWMYIVCGIMSVPSAFLCLLLLPDYPSNTRAWYLTEEDKRLALQRNANVGCAEISGTLNWKTFKPVLSSWRIYTLVVAYIWYGSSCQANNYFAIYLKAEGYSVTMRNVLPALANIASAVSSFLYGFGSDVTRNRFWWILCPLVCVQWPGNAMLAIWPSSPAVRMAGFWIVSLEYMTAVYWTWANEICAGNAEERALTIAAMNGFFYFVNAAIPNAIFLQTDSPSFRNGFPTTWAFGILAAVFVVLMQGLHNREVGMAKTGQVVGEEAKGEGGAECVEERMKD